MLKSGVSGTYATEQSSEPYESKTAGEELLEEKIKDLQQLYYSNNSKNIFFKNKQKLDCATLVCDNIPMETLLSNTIYVIDDSNQVFLDYTIFKLYANPHNYETITNAIVALLQSHIDKFDSFQLHINLHSFTVSALERYKSMIQQFCDKCLSSNTRYSRKMDKTFIYNPPKSFDSIVKGLKPFIDPFIYDKLVLTDTVFPQKNWFKEFPIV